MSNYRLLVIEDDPNIADIVCRVGSEMGFDAYSTSNVLDTPYIYDEFKPHVIVLDIVMPDMDGFEVLSFLHRRESAARVIILSGEEEYRPMASRMAEGLSLPICATLAKPFRIAELRQKLEHVKLSITCLPKDGPAASAAA